MTDYEYFVNLLINTDKPPVSSFSILTCRDYRLHYFKAHYFLQKYHDTRNTQFLKEAVHEIEISKDLLECVEDNFATGRNVENGSHLFHNGASVPEKVTKSLVYCFAGELHAAFGEESLSRQDYIKYQFSIKVANQHCKRLFSFRRCNCYTLSDLKNNTLTLCHPSVLNDPFDSLVLLWKDHLEDICNEKKHIGPMKDSYNFYRIRSFCMDGKESRAVENVLMWSHYAEDHKGFCIEYEFDEGFVDSYPHAYFRHIQYAKEGQPIDLSQKYPIDTNLAFFTKSSKWGYENEVRLLNYNPNEECPYYALPLYDKCWIKSIYFGIKCSTEAKEKIIQILGTNVSYYQMESNLSNVYSLVARKYDL